MEAAGSSFLPLIIDADSPVGRIARTTIPMALDDFYAAYPNSSARVQVRWGRRRRCVRRYIWTRSYHPSSVSAGSLPPCNVGSLLRLQRCS
jgi:hypothetical protein